MTLASQRYCGHRDMVHLSIYYDTRGDKRAVPNLSIYGPCAAEHLQIYAPLTTRGSTFLYLFPVVHRLTLTVCGLGLGHDEGFVVERLVSGRVDPPGRGTD